MFEICVGECTWGNVKLYCLLCQSVCYFISCNADMTWDPAKDNVVMLLVEVGKLIKYLIQVWVSCFAYTYSF